MPEVILPVLDEAAALPWVLGRMPAGFSPIVVDNGSTDGSGAVAAALGARVVTEQVRGFGSACWAGLQAADEDVVCFMDADGSLDPRDLPAVAGPVADGRIDLMLGARHAAHGAWPLHARLANRLLMVEVRRRTGLGLRDLGPMRAARRDGAARSRVGGPAVGLAARDGAEGPPGRLADRRGAGPLPAAHWTIQGDRHGHAAPCRRSATWRRCCGDRCPGGRWRSSPRSPSPARSRPGCARR